MNREKTEPTSILIPQDRSIISPHPESFDTTKKEIRALQNNLDSGVVQNTQSLGVDIVKREGIPLMRQMIARELPPELHAHTPVIERVILEKFSRFLTGNADLGKLVPTIESLLSSENGFAKIQKILEGKTQESDPQILSLKGDAEGIARQILAITESTLKRLGEGYQTTANNPEKKALFLSLFGHSGKLLAYIENTAPLEKLLTDTNIDPLLPNSLSSGIGPLDKKLQELQKLKAPFMQSMAKMPPAFLPMLKDLLGDTFGDVLALVFGKASGKELYAEIELGMGVYQSIERLKSYGIVKTRDGNREKGKNNSQIPILQNLDMSVLTIQALEPFYMVMKQSAINPLTENFWSDIFTEGVIETNVQNGKKQVLRFPNWSEIANKNTPIGLTSGDILAGLNTVQRAILDPNGKPLTEGKKNAEAPAPAVVNAAGTASGLGNSSTPEKNGISVAQPSESFLSAKKFPFSYESGNQKYEVDFRKGMLVIGERTYVITLGSSLGSWASYTISDIRIPPDDASALEMRWSTIIPFPTRFAKKDIPLSEILNLNAGSQMSRTINGQTITFDRVG